MSDASPGPLVSVVIVNYNGRHHLERCLPSVAATSGVEFEVIVVDNGSNDGSVDWLASTWPRVRVLTLGTNLGFGAANRRGAEVARGTFIAFLNNDTVVDAGWLKALLEPLEQDPGIAAACSTLRLLELPDVLNARGGVMTSAGYGYDIDYMVPAGRVPLGGASGRWRDVLFPTAAAAVMRLREFADVGGFDRAMFMYHEDVDLGLRLWLLGRRVVVCDESLVYHAFGGTAHWAHGLAWRERLGMRHNLRTLLKCYRPASLVRAAARIARIWLINRAARQALSTCWWNLVHLPSTLVERRRLGRRRVLSERELFERGLIVGAGWPPAPPEPPGTSGQDFVADLIVTPTLLPGQHSALGRLGAGWFAPERLDGDLLRWTCGLAFCTLKVAPEQAGRLEAEVTFGPHADDAAVTVTCNGASVDAGVGRDWTTVLLPTRSDSQGFLHLSLAAPTWTPHEVLGNWDFRTLGCAVRAIRFRPAAVPARCAEPTVSVVIPTYNRWATLERALEALAGQTYRNFEVIVVDDGSTDGTWERLQAWQHHLNEGRLVLKLLHQENLKPGRARNLGLRHASGELVLFLGDDIIAASDLVAEHVAAHLSLGEPVGVLGFTDWDRDAMAVTPFLELVNRDGQQFSYGHFRDGEDLYFTCFYTSNISLPRDVLGEEPFHPAFTFVDWEDLELGYRLSRRGLRLVLHTAAIAHHFHPMTMAGFFRRQQHVGRTVEVLLGLHPELATSTAMPPLNPRPWYPLLRPVVWLCLPLLSWLDQRGFAFPTRLYRAVLLTAFFAGRLQVTRSGGTT